MMQWTVMTKLNIYEISLTREVMKSSWEVGLKKKWLINLASKAKESQQNQC